MKNCCVSSEVHRGFGIDLKIVIYTREEKMVKTLIYCASGAGERVAYSLDDERYEIIGLVDSNPEVWGKSLYGIDVLSPSEVSNVEFDLIIIGIPEYEKEITNDLIYKYGVDKRKIATYQSQMLGIKWEEERIVMLRKCIALMKERNIEGDMAEVGVYTGEFSKLFNRYFPEKKLYLFDTFSGFDSTRDTVNEVDINNFKDTSVDIVLQKMKRPENCIIRKGYFPDTAINLEGSFSLVSLDCDLYKPILAGLEFFYPRLTPGGYIFVHDFGSYHYEEVKKAVFEYCEKVQAPIFPIVDRCLSVIISK